MCRHEDAHSAFPSSFAPSRVQAPFSLLHTRPERSRRPVCSVLSCQPSTYPFFSFSLTSVYLLLSTLLLSCTSPTPPLPPPPGPDTTSHDFIWHIDTLGDGNSSVLYDVAIINDTTIWAVGEIYVRDSSGQIDPSAYGISKWDGRTWKYERLSAIAPQGYISNLWPRAVFALSKDEIWFAAGGVHRVKYGTLTSYWINSFPGNPAPIWTEGQFAQRLWGSSSTNLYVVGTQGAIAHFNGTTWQRIESGTSITFTDISGTNPISGGLSATLVVGSDFISHSGNRVLSLSADAVTDTLGWPMNIVPAGVWIDPSGMVYVSGHGLWRYENGAWHEELTVTLLNRVRGTNRNNIFTAGSYCTVAQFNGASWKSYQELWRPDGVLRGLAVTDRMVVAVGDAGGKVIAIRGNRP